MRKFFKNKVLYILSATAIIFSCLFMFLFKGPKVEAADLTRETLNHDKIYNNTNTSTGTGSYGNWSWTGITEFNYDGDSNPRGLKIPKGRNRKNAYKDKEKAQDDSTNQDIRNNANNANNVNNGNDANGSNNPNNNNNQNNEDDM